VLHHRAPLLVLISVLVSAGWSAADGDQAVKAPDDHQVARLIRDLSNDDFQVRESAEKRLIQIGTMCLPELRKAISANDPEVRRRARSAIDAIRQRGGDAEVEVDGIGFSPIIDRTWRIPPRGKQMPVNMALRITNHKKEMQRFYLFETIDLVLISERGNKIPIDSGRDRILPGTDVTPLLPSGGSYSVSHFHAVLRHHDGVLRIEGTDGFGGYWYFAGLRPGKYWIQMHYCYTGKESIRPNAPTWTGEVMTDPVSVEIKEE